MADPQWLTDLLDEEVHTRIRDDARTIARPTTFLGWPKDTIFSDVLGGGQADFDAPVGGLSGQDRALLYARYNQRRHLDELGEAFAQLFGKADGAGVPTIIDLGCGPFTAGLALAAAVGPTRPFRYYGVDRATAMCEVGTRFAATAKRLGAFHDETTYAFTDELATLAFGQIRGDLTLVVASYLLASPSLVVDDLVPELVRAVERIGPGPAAILYTNSAKPGPNRNYPRFRELLVAAGFEVKSDAEELFAKTRKPTDLRYALFFRPAKTTVAVRAGRT